MIITTNRNNIQAYLDDFIRINELHVSYSSLIYELLLKGNQDNEIALNSSVKKIIADKLSLSKGSIDNMIGKLNEKDILNRIDRGLYRFNENLYGVTRLKDTDNIKLIVSYKENKKVIKTQINGGK